MKTILATLLLVYSAASFSLYCGNSLITKGTPVHEIINNCDVKYKYKVDVRCYDIVRYYVEIGGMTYNILTIDGVVRAITSSRF